jgi:uncharacterized protein (TIGR00725 family)
MNQDKKLQIAVIGSAGIDDYRGEGGANERMLNLAFLLGEELANKDCIVITGGKDGIMESASSGAKKSGGITVGVIKGRNRFTSNKYVDIEVLTGMEADGMDELNIILMSDGVISVGGGAGTLQELALAYRNNKPIVVIEDSEGWSEKIQGLEYLDERKIVKIKKTSDAKRAVSLLLKDIKK